MSISPTTDPLGRPILRRQTAILYVPEREESDNDPQSRRRSTRPIKEPERLLDELLKDESVQEFYYKDDPSDIDEEELLHYSDEEWLLQQEDDKREEEIIERLSDLDGFVVDDLTDDSADFTMTDDEEDTGSASE